MALRVWLPLNGSLENKGCSDLKVANIQSGVTIDNNGKIGKCYTNSGTTISTVTPISISSKSFSMSAWVKLNTRRNNWCRAFGVVGDGTYAGLACEHTNGSNIGFHFYKTIDGTNTNIFDVYPTTQVVNEWVHWTMCYDGIKYYIYKNGILLTSNNVNKSNIDFNMNKLYLFGGTSGNSSQCSLNDVRIYDHCLSPLEVKEISQGLILHYKLDGFSGGVGENLLSKYVSPGQQNPGVTTTAGRTNYYGDYGIIIPATENADTYFRLFLDKQLEQNAQYTISCEVSGLSSGSYYKFPLFAQNNTAMGVLQLDHNGLCSLTFTMTYSTQSAVTINGRTVYICFMDDSARSIASGQGAITIKNFKLEKGSIATAWSPAPQDLGIDTTKITDSSGYGNDGFLVNGTNEVMGVNNGRYQVCTSLLGTTVDNSSNTIVGAQYLYAPFKMPAWNAITVAWWGNNIAYGRGGIFETTGTTGNIWEGSDYNTTAVANWDSTFGIYNGSTRINIFNNFVKDSTWHYHTITFDGTNVKYYCDSILKQTSALTGTLPAITGFKMGLGRAGGVYRQIKQKLNDLRIYATALSAEDIATLYHTPANIDNLGGIHGFEFIEKQGNMLAVSPLAGSLTWDSENNYYVITSQPSTSTWGIGPSVGVTPKKIIPWGYSYRLSYEVYSPTAATWYVDYNNNTVDVTLSGNDNDTGRIVTGVAVPANQWTLITLGCSNTNNTKNPDHLPLYDYSSGLGPVMTNISSPITWYMRNPQWYLVDIDESTNFQVYENGVFKTNFLKEDNLNNFASFRKNEKATWGVNLIEK